MEQLDLFDGPIVIGEHELEAAYESVKESGMFWEFHPEMTGIWEQDRDKFIDYIRENWQGNISKEDIKWANKVIEQRENES